MTSTGKVAPHEACEVRLVLAGTKPLATIEKRKAPILYSLAVSCAKAGMLAWAIYESKDSPEGEIVITAQRNKHLISEYITLLETGVKGFGIKEYHRKMGRLFGYREEDIEAFIAAEIQCNCAKCTGG
jgi:hypothetical protein